MAYSIEGKEVILLGDTTTHGGKVITASETHKYMGTPIARVGDMVECPKCKGTYPIIEGAPRAFDHGKAIARHGDKVACGATLISRESVSDNGILYAAVATNIATDAGRMALSAWNKDAAVRHAQKQSLGVSAETRQGYCAPYVRRAIEAGGLQLNTGLNSSSTKMSAYGYGPVLTDAGFEALGIDKRPQAGDVVVIQPTTKNPSGHIAIYDGTTWLADFDHSTTSGVHDNNQDGCIYPGGAYVKERPSYIIYRRQ